MFIWRKVNANPAKNIRAGLYKCGECNSHFTVTVGTVCEGSHIKLDKWLMAFYIMCSSKTQMSALQLRRQLEIWSYSSALFMCHRIRYALKDALPSGKLNGTVEADETYVGGKMRGKGRAYTGNKTPVVALIERGGRVRSKVVPKVTGAAFDRLLRMQVETTANLNEFATHDTVNHSREEYTRHDKETGRLATTSAAEGFFGNTKRSIDGIHHHTNRKHLPLYLAEFDHKYNTRGTSDRVRTVIGIQKTARKSLMLRPPTRMAR